MIKAKYEKIILITGASRGIGAATALQAAKQDYFVCVNYCKNEQAANAIVDQIKQQNGKAIAIQADVSQENEVIQLFNTIDNKVGLITALVNNAGIIAKQSRLENISLSRIQQLFTTNVFGSFLCCKEAITRMSANHGGPGGAIVNVSSAASRLGSANEYIDYAATKGAIDTLTIGLAKELAKENIRVNCVRPGFINTDIQKDSGDPNRVDNIKHLIPMQRGGEASEVANAIMWLLSNEASYITGSFIDIAGGR